MPFTVASSPYFEAALPTFEARSSALPDWEPKALGEND